MSSRKRLLLTVIGLSMLLVLLGSGCMWGVVRDAETGAPIAGAQVKYTDANGHTGTATTGEDGRYVFDQASVAVPAAGPVTFEISALGYQPMTAARLVQYNDSNGNLSNLSSFWEVQYFNLAPAGMVVSTAQLLEIDFDKVKVAPISGGTATVFITVRTYTPADPVNPACEQTSAPLQITSNHPAPIHPADFSCIAVGKDMMVSVTVNVARGWTDGGGVHQEEDRSTALSGWLTSTGNWQEIELDSTDTPGPDDADLEFTATVQYRGSTIIPLRYEP
jgi:Carboxypeptidase regulatory-like domain